MKSLFLLSLLLASPLAAHATYADMFTKGRGLKNLVNGAGRDGLLLGEEINTKFCARDVAKCFDLLEDAYSGDASTLRGELIQSLTEDQIDSLEKYALADLSSAFKQPAEVANPLVEQLSKTSLNNLLGMVSKNINSDVTAALVLKIGRLSEAELKALDIDQITEILQIIHFDQLAAGTSKSALTPTFYRGLKNDLLKLAVTKYARGKNARDFMLLKAQFAETRLLERFLDARNIAKIDNESILDLSEALRSLDLNAFEGPLKNLTIDRVMGIYDSLAARTGKDIDWNKYLSLIASTHKSFYQSEEFLIRAAERLSDLAQKHPEALDNPFMQKLFDGVPSLRRALESDPASVGNRL